MPTPDVRTTRRVGRKPPVGTPSAVTTAKAGILSEWAAQPAQAPVADPETRQMMIAEAAYYRAEKRGFAPGGELQDWLEAEAQIQARLAT